MLLEIAMGDAFGRPFEFAPVEHRNKYFALDRYAPVGLESIKQGINQPGIYTDDTQMSLAVANHMISELSQTHYDYAQVFLSLYKADRKQGYSRLGYSRRITGLLESPTAEEFVRQAAKIEPRSSNGCAMRCLPLGLYSTPEQVKHAAVIQTTLTHATLDSIIATQYLALMAHYCYHRLTTDFSDWLYSHMPPLDYRDVKNIKNWGEVSMDALDTVSFVIGNVLEHEKMSEMLECAVRSGGDVDSTCALSLGLASLMEDRVNDLHPNLHAKLENGIFGRDYIMEMDKLLFEKYPRNK